MFILSPLLVGIVIRCYGWMILLADRGLINETLVQRGWLAKPLPLIYNKFGVTLALVHVLWPFMVLSLTGGAQANRAPAHRGLPDSRGVAAPRLLRGDAAPVASRHPGRLASRLLARDQLVRGAHLAGGFKVHVLPMVVYEQVLSVFDWPFGAANAFVLLLISVALIAVYIKVTERALRGIV